MNIDRDELETWGNKIGKSADEMEKELMDLMGHDLIRNILDEDSRIREAMRLLKNRYARSIIMSGNETEYQLMVLGKTSVRNVQVDSRTNPGTKEGRDVLNLGAIGKKKDGSYKWMRLAAWGNDISNTKTEPFTVYKANIKEKTGKGGQQEYTITQNTKWEKVKSISKESAIALLKKTVESIPYTEYPQAVGNNKDYLIEGSIIRHNTFEKDGRKSALYGVRPTDMEDIEVLMESQGLTVWVSPDMMKWGEDSLLMFVGRIGPGKNGGAPTLNADVIIPVIEYPLGGEETSEAAAPPITAPKPAPTPAPAPKPTVTPVAPKAPATANTLAAKLAKPTPPVTASKSYFDEAPPKKEEPKKEVATAKPSISNIRIIKDDDPDPFAPEP